MANEFSEKNLGLTRIQVEKSPLGITLSKFMLETEKLYEQGFTEFRRRFRGYRFCDDPYCFEITFGAHFFEPHIIKWPGLGIPSIDRECLTIPKITTELSSDGEDVYCLHISFKDLIIDQLIIYEHVKEATQLLKNEKNKFRIFKVNEPDKALEYDTLILNYHYNSWTLACNRLLNNALVQYWQLVKILEHEEQRQIQTTKNIESNEMNKHQNVQQALNDLKNLLK